MTSPLAQVLGSLELEQTDDLNFVAESLPQAHGRVYGGQVLAQAILAAAHTVAPSRQIHSLHGYFLRAGDLAEPIRFAVEELRDGRSFSARRTHAIQHGKPILSMIASFQEDQPGVTHQDVAPPSPPPESLPSSLDLFLGLDPDAGRLEVRTSAFDIRHVDDALYTGPAQQESTSQRLWMRADGSVPPNQSVQRALLAFACDQVILEPVLRAHGLGWFSRGGSLASLDHAMWWHRPVDLNDWLLFDQRSPAAQGSRGLGEAKVFNRRGELVASIAQEGMIRIPDPQE